MVDVPAQTGSHSGQRARRTAKGAANRRRRLPPGQRLLVYALLSLALLFWQGCLLPFGSGLEPLTSDKRVRVRPPFQETVELQDLSRRLRLECNRPGLAACVFVIDSATGRYVDIEAGRPAPAASMIKIPVLVAALAAMDNGSLGDDEELTISPQVLAAGSGYLQWRPVGSRVTVSECAEVMIVNSDNTATNMLIERLGGRESLNKLFADWGLQATRINNPLPDLEGTNTTSPRELALVIGKVAAGGILSETGRQRMFAIMSRTKRRNLLPDGLAAGAAIAHKTGDIGGMVGDAGLVTAPNNSQYLIAVQVCRPHNDLRADQLVRDISHIVYNHLIAGQPADLIQPPGRNERRPAR